MPVIQIGESTDNYLYPGAVDVGGILRLYNNAAEALRVESARGAKLRVKTVEAVEAALTGATDTIGSNTIPDGAFVLGVVVYNTILITASGGGASYSIGDGTDADKWGAGIAFTAGTVTTAADFTAGPSLYTAATNIVLTVNTGAFTAGGVRAAVFYIDFAALLS